MTTTFLLGGDLPVARIGFGAMRLAANGFSGPPRDPRTSREVLQLAVAAGVDHIDTAEFYVSDDGSLSANGLIREALHPYPAGLVLATKVGPVRTPDGGVQMTLDPSLLREQVHANLRSLGVERLDLVYLRLGDADARRAGSVRRAYEELAALRSEGLIRHLGLSNTDEAALEEAQAVAPVAAIQNHFHPRLRQDAHLLRTCEDGGIAFVPFFPLGGGFEDISDERIAAVAARRGATVPQVALAWLLAQSPVTLAIPGTGSPAHLAENMGAAELSLSPQDLAELV